MAIPKKRIGRSTKKTTHTALPGSIYLNKNRYWWKVQLPGEIKAKARPLRPIGSKFATTDYNVAFEVAKAMLEKHLFETNQNPQTPVITSFAITSSATTVPAVSPAIRAYGPKS